MRTKFTSLTSVRRCVAARVAVAAVCIGLVSGCGAEHGEYFGTTAPLHDTDVLWINNGAEAQWIDPGKCADSNGGDVIWNTFAGLVEAHPATLDPIPDIARDWQVSADGTTYTFHLRETAWSDGTRLTAHDFEWSWKRLLDAQTGSKYAYIGYVLANGEAFSSRAIHVRQTPPNLTAEQLQTLAAAIAPVDRVEAAAGGNGLFVFTGVQADEAADPDELEEQRQANRTKLLAALSGHELDGTRLHAELTAAEMVGVRALDDRTLEVRLQTPVPYLLHLLSFYSFMPVPRHVIERLEREGVNTDLWTRPEHFVSNGAYVMTDWRFRQYMIFERNPHYWDAANVRVPKIKALMVENYNTSLNLYFTGEIDFVGGNTSLPAEFMDHLQQYQDYRFDPYMGSYFYWFNTKAPPLDNVLVRRALSLALDREKITTYITRAGQIPVASLVPDGLAGYQGLDLPLFDPAQAQQLLAEAGYPGGQGLPKITLIYNTSEGHKQIAEACQQMWKEHLHIDVAIENQEWNVYLKRLEMMDFQVARMGWIGDYPDPYTFLDLVLPTSGNNHSNWKSDQYADLLKQANQTLNPAARLAKLRAAEQMLMDVQPVLPIYVYTRSQMVKPYIRGFWGNYQDRHLWKYIWIDPDFRSHPADEPPPPRPRG